MELDAEQNPQPIAGLSVRKYLKFVENIRIFLYYNF
jgi:hypothetical protein